LKKASKNVLIENVCKRVSPTRATAYARRAYEDRGCETENCLYTTDALDDVLMETMFPCPIRNQILQIKKFSEVEKK